MEMTMESNSHQQDFGDLRYLDGDDEGEFAIGDLMMGSGQEGLLDIQWEDGSVTQHKFSVDHIEPGGSNGPYVTVVDVEMIVHGVNAWVPLNNFAGKAKARVVHFDNQ